MVHVGVGQQDEIDGGKVFDQNAGAPLTAEDDETFGKDGVYQDFAAIDLKQKRGVADEGHTKLIVIDQLDRPRASGDRLLVALSREPPQLLHFFHCERSTLP